MSILVGFAPWFVYWVLVGNVPFEAAVLVALGVAVASFVIGRVKRTPGRTLEIGAIGTFVVLAILTFTLSQSFMEQWIQPLSNAGIFLVALAGMLTGRPFVREFAEVDQPDEVIASETFKRITNLLTWIWIGAFAGMTVSSAIPPIVYGDATILDTRTPLSFLCYWIIPFTLLGLAALASRVLPEKMGPSDDEERKTSFVTFAEAEIDQLMYAATEAVNREVGKSKEAYDIRIGSKGIPLSGDETRESWPATYKVRPKR
ncbi:hypothetical protein [Mycobacterium sp. ITM-2016-00318]|uniref:hypothetical protein n=1 Tax=Mycobacterium sp. ITM-2016-00318 TaxID=2099693 RepID=UPI000CF9414D|nr:hypothetical protein [Mycobacterium sp. ITM-2016-00318]WNG94943.1 hypothetical protein C6A82_011195 [Mycobacterium sp. ITM-2016-00318]